MGELRGTQREAAVDGSAGINDEAEEPPVHFNKTPVGVKNHTRAIGPQGLIEVADGATPCVALN
ncbi:MAG: hypothetical protein AAF773_22540 [Cyanobacteria bacterium P01_D01_bin.115]